MLWLIYHCNTRSACFSVFFLWEPGEKDTFVLKRVLIWLWFWFNKQHSSRWRVLLSGRPAAPLVIILLGAFPLSYRVGRPRDRDDTLFYKSFARTTGTILYTRRCARCTHEYFVFYSVTSVTRHSRIACFKERECKDTTFLGEIQINLTFYSI